MKVTESQSPLAAAAELLRNNGVGAPAEAMERAVKSGSLGDDAAATFWVEVMIEVFDAQAAMSSQKPSAHMTVVYIHRETAGRLVESDRTCLRARQTLRELKHCVAVSALTIERSKALLRRVQSSGGRYSNLSMRQQQPLVSLRGWPP